MRKSVPGRPQAAPDELRRLGQSIIQAALKADKVEVAARVLEQLARLEPRSAEPRPAEAAGRRLSDVEGGAERDVVVYSALPITEEEWRRKFGPSE